MQRSLSGQVLSFILLILSRIFLACCRRFEEHQHSRPIVGQPQQALPDLPDAPFTTDTALGAADRLGVSLEDLAHDALDRAPAHSALHQSLPHRDTTHPHDGATHLPSRPPSTLSPDVPPLHSLPRPALVDKKSQ